MTGLMDEKEAAALIGCSIGLMRKWRLHNQGPAYSRIGRLVRYQERDLIAFIEASRIPQGEVQR